MTAAGRDVVGWVAGSICVAVLLGSLEAAAAAADRAGYAIIVANNSSLDSNVKPLRYADDDGAAYYELFENIVEDVSLLAVLDLETQRQHPNLAQKALPPTLQALRDTLQRVNAAMARDRERGDAPIFYFIYAGHGDVLANGEGYINLADARFSRSDLFREVIAPSQASFNHIVVDACNSYYLVNSRNDRKSKSEKRTWRDDRSEQDHSEQVSRFLALESLKQHPSTGVILSTSSAAESHEWEAYRAGVFSHELRSALTGAADVNGDGLLEYSEVKAFTAAANAGIDDPRARLRVFAAPPAIDARAPLVDLTQAKFPSVLLVPEVADGPLYLEDDRGVRYADFHSDGKQRVAIALADARYYFLRSADREIRIDTSMAGIHLVADGWRRHAAAARGATAENFRRGLFRTAYGPEFYRGYVISSGEIPVQPQTRSWLADASLLVVQDRLPTSDNRWRRASAIAGSLSLAAGIGALTMELLRRDVYQDYRSKLERTGYADPAIVNSIDRHRTGRNILIGVTSAAVSAGITIYLWDRVRLGKDRIAIGVAKGGSETFVSLQGSF
ncbi:MAG: caspase family protein [Pseudomonadota bacterium]